MATYSIHADLSAVLLKHCETIRKQRHAVLFHRGDEAFGMFLVLEGRVGLDFGVDGSNPLNGTYGSGALVGLPASLTGRSYSMTATVTEDSQLGFISCKELKELLREEPEITQHLLAILSAKVAQTEKVRKALLEEEEAPVQHVGLA